MNSIDYLNSGPLCSSFRQNLYICTSFNAVCSSIDVYDKVQHTTLLLLFNNSGCGAICNRSSEIL